MNRIKLVLGLLAAGAVCSASAQLQFTNLTLSTSPNLFHGLTNQLNSVIFGGSSNFLAVGANQIYVYGNFQPGQTWITNSGWVTNKVSLVNNGLNLASVTIGNNTFVTTGTSNAVFSAANTPAGLSWTRTHNIFSSSVFASAVAYNNGGFAAAAESPQLSWSSTPLPPSTTWVPGTIANADFLESFRGLTPYGANGFAVCGLYADVRISPNGTNWPAAVSGHIGLPDLYSIAWDGVQTLVAVGATNSSSTVNGVIMVSVNSGNTVWSTVYVNNTANTPLNSVTYTGSGFIAVGNKGQVLTSSNGITWTAVANTGSLTNSDLYGVAYANSGPLIGVSEMVGASGAVVLAATPPPSPINPVGETNCSTFPNPPSYTALSVTPVTDANHPAGTVSVDWYDAKTNLVASGTTNFTPTINPNLVGTNTATNIIYYAVERDLRTGFICTNRTAVTLQLIPRPTATLINPGTTVCNEGTSFTLTNILTGIGPWTVIWNDAVTQTVAQVGPGPAVLTRTVTPTNTFANVASNNVYFVTIVTNADMCQGNIAGDITGSTTITVDPRPTATLTPLDTTNCNDGSSYTLTNTLTGLGPWNLVWNDNTIQAVLGNSGPVVFTRTVFPTNSVGANAASNNVYYIKSVNNADTCDGNQPGDVTGTNHIVINPRPTAKLLGLGATNCDLGTSYTLTNMLTGIGPWTVVWNDGTIQTTNGAGPLALIRNVTPTTSSPNAASNNVYFVTIVTNADTCIGNQPGDITGINNFLINPLPTVTLTIKTNDFALSTNGIATGLLESVNQPGGTSYNLVVGFQSLQNGNPYTISNQTLSVTNHLTFTGIGPWAVMLSDGNTVFVTNYSANSTYVWKEIVSTNFNTNFTFSVTSLTDTNTGCSGSETNIYSVGVFGAPTAAVAYSTNTECGSGSGSILISASLGGFGPWTNIVWSDGFASGLVSSSPVSRNINVATNNSFAQIVSNYTIVSLTDVYGTTTTSSNNLTGVAAIIVDPFPTNPPTAVVATNTTCPSTPVVLSVSVPPGFTADWFADSGLTTNLALSTTNYMASIADEPATNIYYVTMRYDDAFSLTNCQPDVAASVYLITTACTNIVIDSITATNGNVVISWNGTYVLQGTTNLVPPTVWFNLSTGQLGQNFLTNPVSGYPYEFFRLGPTN
jgi:hypothetical protein